MPALSVRFSINEMGVPDMIARRNTAGLPGRHEMVGQELFAPWRPLGPGRPARSRQLHRLSQLVVARSAPLQPDETRRFIRCHPEIIFNRDDGGEISRCIARQTEVNRVHILSGEDSIPGLARETYRFAETKSPAVQGRCSGRVRN